MTIRILTVYYLKGVPQQRQAYRIHSYHEYLKLWNYYKQVHDGIIDEHKSENCWKFSNGTENVGHADWETSENRVTLIVTPENL